MPNGGLRMVEAGLAAYGFTLDPVIKEVWSKYRKSHNQGVFDTYTPEILAAQIRHHHRSARCLWPWSHHWRLPPGCAPAAPISAQGTSASLP
jgi:hypothetical protein